MAPKDHGCLFREATADGHRIVLLEIDAAEGVPTRFEGDPYIRVGPATPKLHDHPDRERRLIEALLQGSFEDDPAMENVRDDEVFELLDIGAALTSLRENPEPAEPSEMLEQFRRYGLIERLSAGFWTITNRAALLFAHDLSAFGDRYERKATRVVLYGGDSRVETRLEQSDSRGYALSLEPMFDWINERLPRNEQIRGAVREDVPLYPLRALRELVANALVHQDLFIRGTGPMIEIFEHRIEITNPGAPLGSVDRLLDEPPRSRNERLASLMRQMRFCA